jgi:O-antigen/teichoic acid export membrane protein
MVAATFLSQVRGTTELFAPMRALATVIPFLLAREHLRRVAFAAERGGDATILDAAVSVAQLSGVLALAAAGLLTPVSAILTLGAAAGVGTVIWTLTHRREFTFSLASITHHCRNTWNLGRWISGSGVLAIVTAQLYPWLIATLHGTSATAVWAACISIVGGGNSLIQAMTNHIGPAAATRFAMDGPAALSRLVRRTGLLFTATMIPVCLGSMVWGGFVLTALYGSAYAGNGTVVWLLTMNVLATGLGVIASRGLFAVNCAYVDFMINLLPFAIAGAAGVILIRLYGPTGAAVSTLIGNSIAAFSRYRGLQLALRGTAE